MPQWLVNIGTYLKDAALGVFTGTVADVKARALTWRTAGAILLVGFCLCGVVCSRPAQDSGFNLATLNGWVDDPAGVAAQVKTFPLPYFGDAGKQLIQMDQDRDALLYEAYRKVTGHEWKAHCQNYQDTGVGDCVGEGFSSGVELTQCVEIALGNEPEEYKPISASAMYALSRQIGGDIGKRNEGSRGADAAKALMTLGALSCEEAGDENSGKQHIETAKKWGVQGLPANLKALAKVHLIKTASLVRTPEEVRTALVNGYLVPICSNVGFANPRSPRQPANRDENGYIEAYGTWNHCMLCCGYRADKKQFCIIQSWGDQTPGGPTTLGQPSCSFWVSWQTMQRIVRQGDSYAISAFDGYKARDLPLFIKGNNPLGELLAKGECVGEWRISPLRFMLQRLRHEFAITALAP